MCDVTGLICKVITISVNSLLMVFLCLLLLPFSHFFTILLHTKQVSIVWWLSCDYHVTGVGGDALVNSGVMESLLQVLEWKAVHPMNITVRTIPGVNIFIFNFFLPSSLFPLCSSSPSISW